MNTEEHQASAISGVVGFSSILCLLGSLGSLFLIIPSIGPGFYGGTAVLIFFLLVGQIVIVIAGALIPILIQKFRRRLHLNAINQKLLIGAIIGVAFEAAALYLIPVSGAS